MKLFWMIHIDEKYTSFCTVKVSNRPLAIVCATLQLAIAMASLLQHVFSIYRHRHVFLCKSQLDEGAGWEQRYLAYDVIIFDFGLMNRVLGTEECVANYLDGGYMRFGWCMQHVSALTITILALAVRHRPIWLLWPGLLLQSSYSLGLSVLTMATAPKILEALGGKYGKVDVHLASSFVVYVCGFMFNWVFTFILWHHYWHEERQLAERRRGEEGEERSHVALV